MLLNERKHEYNDDDDKLQLSQHLQSSSLTRHYNV